LLKENTMRIPLTLFFAFAGALLLNACSSVDLKENKPPIEERTGTAPGGADSRTVSTVNATTTNPLNDPKGVLAKRSIYFDVDSYSVRDEFKPLLEAHARYLSADKSRRIAIQGNTDERGGAEYNLALGQKRADNQMEAVSFGKEKPKAQGSDEASWTENRRADIVY
jgi:peptidoglycan-associated lipoprotein